MAGGSSNSKAGAGRAIVEAAAFRIGAVAPRSPPDYRRSSEAVDEGTVRPCQTLAVGSGSVRECRGRLAADDRRGLADEILVLEGIHHEQREIYAAREVALEDRVAHVAAPHG
jgi:hypothetical protein